MKPAKRKPRKPSKAEVKAAASRAEATSRGEPAADPKVAITPEIIPMVTEEERSKEEPKARGRGRPSPYEPSFAEVAAELCDAGATDPELAEYFDVSTRTIDRWKLVHEEFRLAIKDSKKNPDDRVHRSLYHRAMGTEYEEAQPIKLKRTFYEDGKKVREEEYVEIVMVKKVIPADTTAAIFWLKNRRKADWSEKSTVDHTGTVTTVVSEPKPIPSDHLSDITKRFSSRVPADTVGTGPAKAAEKPAKGADLH